MKRHKILMVTPFFPPDKGGIADHVYNVTKRIENSGHAVTIVAPKSIRRKNVSSEESNVIRLNSVFFPGWPYSTLKSFSLPIDGGSKLNSLIRNSDFDIVHVHGHHYFLSWKAIKSAAKEGIPTVLTLHGMWALNPKRLGGKSKIEEIFNEYKFKDVLSYTNNIIGLTQNIINYAKKYGNNNSKYFIIPNGVDTSIYSENLSKKNIFRKKYNLDENKKIIFFCGRLEDVKGIKELVGAIKQLTTKKNFEVIIAGDGTLKNFVHNSLKSFSNVHILEWQPSSTIHELYIASDIFVIPSKFEALPLTLIEAMNAGLHVVYTEVGGIPDIVKQYNAKTLLREVTILEIAKTLEDLIGKSDILASSDSLEYARMFDWDKIAKQTIDVYDKCSFFKK